MTPVARLKAWIGRTRMGRTGEGMIIPNGDMQELAECIGQLKDVGLVRPPQVGGTHYGAGLQPWDLQCDMPTSGDVFIDARRTDVMEYVFRLKADSSLGCQLAGLRADALKARHNLDAIIARIDQIKG